MAQTEIPPALSVLFADFAEATELHSATRLKEDLGMDSMDLVRLVMDLNQSFGLKIQSREITPQNFAELGALLKYLKSKNVF